MSKHLNLFGFTVTENKYESVSYDWLKWYAAYHMQTIHIYLEIFMSRNLLWMSMVLKFYILILKNLRVHKNYIIIIEIINAMYANVCNWNTHDQTNVNRTFVSPWKMQINHNKCQLPPECIIFYPLTYKWIARNAWVGLRVSAWAFFSRNFRDNPRTSLIFRAYKHG